jgi:triacylglycerol lipase
MFYILFLFLLLSLFRIHTTYDINEANVCVFLSGSAYCNKENYNDMVLSGPANGLEVKSILYDKKSDLQGYIGIIPDRETIYVVFRGSSSGLNWIKDFEIKKVTYDTYSECNCTIHKGFYESALAVRNEVILELQKLLRQYAYKVIVTAHSYGAAVGQIMAMELYKVKIPVEVYNFGQPRIGDINYATFVNKILTKYWRFTHNKDIVPHVPTIKYIDYYHSCGEIFENENHDLKTCSTTDCEDIHCADQYPLKDTNVDDHLLYLQHPLTCEDSTV